MEKSVIFIGGSSGTGKTTISAELHRNMPNSEKFRFCDTVGKEAKSLNLSRIDLLQQWYSLQTLVVKNLVIPIMRDNKTIIFDTHYAQPLSDNPDITFAKRSISLSHASCMSFGNDFLKRMAQINTPMFLFLLRADERAIQDRLARDSASHKRNYMTSLDMIRKEKIEEEEAYEKTIWVLKEFRAQFEHHEIETAHNQQTNITHMLLKVINESRLFRILKTST